jgi:alpha-tubulin suppressor-like RCC1 family protein
MGYGNKSFQVLWVQLQRGGGRAHRGESLKPIVNSAAAGYRYSYVLMNDGSLWGMESNGNGRLGDGTGTSRNAPVEIVSSGVNKVSVWDHTLFGKTNGSLWGMGRNNYGQLGINSTTATITQPTQIVTSGVSSLVAGYYHSAFVKTDGSVWTMGNNLAGQLGTGDYLPSQVPVKVINSGASQVACGQYHTLVKMADGSRKVFGSDRHGAIGQNRPLFRSTPYQINHKLLAP